MHKTDHNHRTKTDNMTSNLILDNVATIVQASHKTKIAHIAKGLITLPEKVKFVLIAWKLDISVMSAPPQKQVIETKQVYASGF